MKLLPFLLLIVPFSTFSWGATSFHPALSVDTAIRIDQFDWSIAGTLAGTDPNILSELTWKDLKISQIRLRGELDLDFENLRFVRPHLRGQLGLGRIYSGENQDSDYNGDDRTLEFSRSKNAADNGDVLDFSLAAGPKFVLLSKRLELIPLIGYSYHRQELTLQDGFQSLPANGPFSGLDSSYNAEWWGGWVGIEVKGKVSRRFQLKGLSEYHKVEYYAGGDWNLRPELAHPLSFTHVAKGSGWIHELGLDILLAERWSLTVSGVVQRWKTDAGHNRVFLATGQVQETRLSVVNWKSTSLHVGVSYQF